MSDIDKIEVVQGNRAAEGGAGENPKNRGGFELTQTERMELNRLSRSRGHKKGAITLKQGEITQLIEKGCSRRLLKK